MSTTAFIGLGSNIGDRLGNVSAAVDAIAHLPETHVENVSSAYESAAAYNEEQPNFINAVVEVSTGLAADALLEYLLELETKMGRTREEARVRGRSIWTCCSSATRSGTAPG